MKHIRPRRQQVLVLEGIISTRSIIESNPETWTAMNPKLKARGIDPGHRCCKIPKERQRGELRPVISSVPFRTTMVYVGMGNVYEYRL